MKTIPLRASDEAALVAALPMLRGVDAEGSAYWIEAGPLCDCVVFGALELVPPVVDPDSGDEIEAGVLDERCHANLRGPRAGADPDAWVAVLDAAAPFILTEVFTMRRRFAR